MCAHKSEDRKYFYTTRYFSNTYKHKWAKSCVNITGDKTNLWIKTKKINKNKVYHETRYCSAYEMFWQKNHVYQTTIDFYSTSILSVLPISKVYLSDVYPKLERGVQFPRGWSKTGKLGYRSGGGPKLIMHAGQMEMPAESWHISYAHLPWQNERGDSKTARGR